MSPNADPNSPGNPGHPGHPGHRRVFSLSIHADYRCRHSGVCCTTGWDVPLELPFYNTLAAAVQSGRLRPSDAAGTLAPFVVDPDLPDDAAAIFERTDAGHCVFFDGSSRLCIVHRDLGEPALPSTCRHFPRVAVRDARGTFITLSHYCPTAASMLFRDDVELDVVENPPAFPAAEYEGLVVGDDELPPLLSPHMLMDYDGYAAWERHMVARCRLPQPVDTVLATLRRDAHVLRQWKPGDTTLAAAVTQLPGGMSGQEAPAALERGLAQYRGMVDAVPEEMRPERDEDGLEASYACHVRPSWDEFRAPLNRYVAGKAFASWTAYQGRGVISIVTGLAAAVDAVRVEAAKQCRDAGRPLDADLLKEAFRGADFLLNHLAVGEDLASRWSEAEE